MDYIMGIINEYWPLFIAAGVALDFIVGKIPDKYVPYIGALRRFFGALKGKGKTGETIWAIPAVLAATLGGLALLGLCLGGCATKPTKAQYIAGAKIIAREAGNLVAMNNPEMATAVRLGYNMIKDEDGDEFRALFANGLQQMLAAEGVAGSERLAKSAADLLAVFGLDVPDTGMIDAEYLEKFAVGDIKDIAVAFIEGMGPE
jgi:hypothetical protein